MLLGRYSSFVEALFNLYDRADANAVDAREVCACRLAHAHACYVWHGQTVTRVVACRPPCGCRRWLLDCPSSAVWVPRPFRSACCKPSPYLT